MSQLRDERDDMLFLWFALLVLIFVVIPALYAAHKGSVNAPLVWLASMSKTLQEVKTELETVKGRQEVAEIKLDTVAAKLDTARDID